MTTAMTDCSSDTLAATLAATPADIQVDATGLFCPEPVMMLHSRFRDMTAGQTLLLTATDPSTTRDVPKFCHFLGHDLVATSTDDGIYRYLLRKN